VRDAVAVGVPHERLGQAIVLVASAPTGVLADTDALVNALRRRLPRHMVPLAVDWRDSLPRSANGKFDRARLRQELSVSLDGHEPDQSAASPETVDPGAK
jgi:acyl-CoA synthetase (AMP-forming)/AMP-acid ligase II